MAVRVDAMTSPFATPERRIYDALRPNDVARIYRGGINQGAPQAPQRALMNGLKKVGIAALGGGALGGIAYATRDKWKPLLNKFKKPVPEPVNITNIYR